MTDFDALIDAERNRLIGALERLDDERWNSPSLCGGWRVRDVVVHLLMPYQMSLPRFFINMAAAGFAFDRMADRWATRDTRPKDELLSALRRTKAERFGVPGAGPEAPLSHLVIHAEDIYRPLKIDHLIEPESANIVLDQLTTPQAQRSLKPGLIDGLAFSTQDTGWRHGTGAQVLGSASALISTLAGRQGSAAELTGEGAILLQGRGR
jgi:uncharacterized protein (TIGR03083 family)